MALLCYNRGCGQRFDPEANADGKEERDRQPSAGLPLPTSGPLHLSSPHAVPREHPWFLTPLWERRAGRFGVPGAPHCSVGIPCTSSILGLPEPGLHFVTAVIPGCERYN